MMGAMQHRGDPQAMALATQSGGAGLFLSLLSFAGSILSIIMTGALISAAPS